MKWNEKKTCFSCWKRNNKQNGGKDKDEQIPTLTFQSV